MKFYAFVIVSLIATFKMLPSPASLMEQAEASQKRQQAAYEHMMSEAMQGHMVVVPVAMGGQS